MKLLLIIALAIVSGFQSAFDPRDPFSHAEKITNEPCLSFNHAKGQSTTSSGATDARHFIKENKASANAAGYYDTIMPALCLLMLVWLSFTIPGKKKRE